MRITVVFDNREPAPGYSGSSLGTAWGFACVVDTASERILFDTGSDGATLVDNMRALGIDPGTIDILMFSHEHWDHTGGVDALFESGARPTAYVPQSFSAEFREHLASHGPVIEVDAGSAVGATSRTTGEMGVTIIEQALAVETSEGLVVVSGCAHPGIAEMVRVAADGCRVALVIGGFHLKDADERKIDTTVDALEALGVDRVAPTHCTGDDAIARFAVAFGDRYSDIGVGSVLEVGL